MSVICENQIDGQFRAFVKGSPEKIQELSKAIPVDFQQILELYTKEGYRVIALAEKVLVGMDRQQALEVPREQIENDLNFLGLLVMENKLKPETTGAIKQL